ncbi:MAG: hypothetical protein A3F85_01480 [Candidatus Ryanbacteria bacterium RIFCSPLOWO2_12_FULL_44_26]|nr:MAG: hypothetical protein A2718_02800 [Candidatus Ryanbacteria bacterium RIFCSPHIGHO2_01_FULL_44_130]OGZ56010.1 MAG: hypothetical protein A3F85_01480 [Candidatus Ryanbacteria bacterium RIFCSPLOWO2_12_FULL_44_26]
MLMVVLFTVIHFSAIPDVSVRDGIIVWNIPFPFDAAFNILLALIAFPLAFAFITTRVMGEISVSLKKFFLGLSLILGGAGGIGITVFRNSFFLIKVSHIILFAGFVMLGGVFIFSDILGSYRKPGVMPENNKKHSK